MEFPNSNCVALLTHAAENGATAIQIADAIVAAWQAIDIALRPIVGRGSVSALYKRTLSLTVSRHSWLSMLSEGIQSETDLIILASVLAQQNSLEAATGGGAALQTFCELLASLIGPLAHEQLLRSVWATSFSGLSQLHGFMIDDKGICLAQMVSAQKGLLGGRPNGPLRQQ